MTPFALWCLLGLAGFTLAHALDWFHGASRHADITKEWEMGPVGSHLMLAAVCLLGGPLTLEAVIFGACFIVEKDPPDPPGPPAAGGGVA
jgi:hypothetical protein